MLSGLKQLYDAMFIHRVQVAVMSSEDDRFRKMVEHSQDWFWEFDENAFFTYVSPQIRNLLGYDPSELIGLNAFDLMDADEAERVHEHFDPIAKKYLPFRRWWMRWCVFCPVKLTLSQIFNGGFYANTTHTRLHSWSQPDHCDWQSKRICPSPGVEEGIRIHNLQHLLFM